MQGNHCNIMTQDNSFFDITHTFQIGSSTYHVLGVRKDRPTYKNTYYIFNCDNGQHEPTHDASGRPLLVKRLARTTEQTKFHRHRPVTAHYRKTTTTVDEGTTNFNESKKGKAPSSRARTESPKSAEINPEIMRETFNKALRSERQMLLASFRKQINVKNKVLIKSIKEDRRNVIQTINEEHKADTLRLLEEHNKVLTKAYEQFVGTTISSIHMLKQTLIDTLESQQQTSQSHQELQLNLLRAIEQEIQTITAKKEDSLQSTLTEINSIKEAQTAHFQKLEEDIKVKKHTDDAILHRLFNEQKQALTQIIEHQQPASVDLIKRTIVDVLNQQRTTSDESITDIVSHHTQSNNEVVASNTIHSLPNMRSNPPSHTLRQSSLSLKSKPSDQYLFTISIRTPEPAHLYAKLLVDGEECSRRLHTLCQRDIMDHTLYNCYVAPPKKDRPYELTIYAKTAKETTHRAAISIRVPESNGTQLIEIPMVHQAFEDHQCILIEPLQRSLPRDKDVRIHMKVPGALQVKIRNGDSTTELDSNEYRNYIVKKTIRVRGDVSVLGSWKDNPDLLLCVFETQSSSKK
ncbi:unnamed protein product [Adineta ricciae]|uniref:Uncharacterized protein n=1 Tax=Adineta ricciae TaxID=249248 RepID=A0A814TXI8_ADIRI|nr:unnamed protein product [Adineta ricciae]CAF1186747.1 unnamed protein product [Adineta ricciae]